jgi:uncharacterized membrane protein YagU involved in acid resistance
MTAAMEVMHRQLPRPLRYPLEPRLITMKTAEEAGVKQDLDENQRLATTLLAHFGMGAVAGTLYGLWTRRLPLPRPLAGATYGLAVWAANYAGVLPSLGLLESPVRRPRQRTALLIASHLVWGVSLALATEGLQRFFRSR